MALKRRVGFSLIETVVYSGLLLIVGLLLATLFRLSQKTQRTTASAYAVTGQTDTAIHWLRRDFKETALSSIRVYPKGELLSPSVTLCSARVLQGGGDSQGKLLISEYGVPAWSYSVYYGLKREPGAQTGSLLRWEVPLTAVQSDRIPKIGEMPTTLDQVIKPRVILQNVLAPNATVEPLNGLPNGWVANDWGGFRVEFVRRQGGEGGAETMTDVNPARNVMTAVYDGDAVPAADARPASYAVAAADNTRLVEVELGVAEPSMGAPNFYSIKFRVFPRY